MYAGDRSLTVGEIMSFPVITGKESDSIRSIAAKIKKHDINGVVIVDKDHTPLRVITSGDIVGGAMTKGKSFFFSKVKHIIRKPVHTITRERTLEEAARYMIDNKVKSICVVDGSNKLIGIITEDDITKNAGYLIEVLNELVRTGYTGRDGTVSEILE